MKRYRVYATAQIMTAKAALILAVALVAGIALWIYFSPFQTCLRVLGEDRVVQCAVVTTDRDGP